MVRENKHPSMKQLKILKIIRTKFIKKNFFSFFKLICSAIMAFCYRGIKRRNWEQQIGRNEKLNIHFKNNFNFW